MTAKPKLQTSEVTDWLTNHYGATVSGVTKLDGGYWSTAFAFKTSDDNRVIRFNPDPEGFSIDQQAFKIASPYLPVPEVLETGEALNLSFAISRRHSGSFLELSHPDDASRLQVSINALLRGLRSVPSHPEVEWYKTGSNINWKDYLLRSLSSERNEKPRPEKVQAVYQQAESRIRELLPACPERRDLVHGDLLHQNVLVSEDAAELHAVFSWKCSAYGDFVYDTAWCTHWSACHPGIAAANVYQLTVDSEDLTDQDKLNLTERHHCYELQIAASHIDWYLWTNDKENLNLLVSNLNKILKRGPL